MSAAPRVKVCCIGSVDEARQAVAAGAAALGLVSAMPSGPGVIDDERIAEIAAAVRGLPVRTFLLTARVEAEAGTDPAARVDRAFRLALQRRPQAEEREVFAGYAQRHGWAAACRLLLNLNEFVFVD